MTRNKKIVIIGGIILVVGISIGVYQCLFSAPEKELETERIVINLGTTEEELIPKLKEQGYIRSEWAFKFVLKRKDWQGKIEPGGYKVSKNMNAWTLAETLVNYPYQRWVVIPEGLRKEEIAEIIQKELGWTEDTKNEFLTYAKEGYLFPDTYLLQVLNFENAGKQAAKRMENTFNEKNQEIFKEFEENNIRNDTAIILSSIIQREAANEEEMPLIAGIIWNRLLKPMPLQVDATIQYIVGEPGNWWRPVTPEEYKIESPYNTYLHKGKPPAPICNPGLAAIEAVVHDQPSDYLYYLHDSEGQIHLAKTYEEHLENIDKYLILPKVREVVTEFMEARIQRKQPLAENFLTDNAKAQYSQPELTLIGTSNPHFESFEILEIEKLDSTQFKFKVRIYEEYTGKGRVGYFDESLIMVKKDGKYMVDSVERSEYKTETKENLTPRQVVERFLEADMVGARLGGEIAKEASEIKKYYTLSSGFPTGFAYEGDLAMVIKKYEILNEYPSEDRNSYYVKVKYFCEKGIAPGTIDPWKIKNEEPFVVIPCSSFFELICPRCFEESTKTPFMSFDLQEKTQTVTFELIKDKGEWRLNSPSICPHVSEETLKKEADI